MRIPLMLSVATLALAIPTLGLAQRAAAPPEPVKVDPAVAKARDGRAQGPGRLGISSRNLTTEVGQRLAATEAEARRGGAWAVIRLKKLGFQKRSYRNLQDAGLGTRRRDRRDRRTLSAEKLVIAALGPLGARPHPRASPRRSSISPTLADPCRRARRQPEGQDRVRLQPDGKRLRTAAATVLMAARASSARTSRPKKGRAWRPSSARSAATKAAGPTRAAPTGRRA